ncbi:hypothetical protein PNEG_02827 [Pneumocystis murina B123]|uniref:C2H2-type domain-containing protein n=1 Tax=Pneumocystis murina (strain B123) TaxID=1069680 RepID=M7NPM7_PNEMU|nr:hypothetical protein PNEG_02827 [Pneumocystis murina B123]EMR09056.1 hypothetical protein PNEG_02827 [Pneumocystis murina B123]
MSSLDCYRPSYDFLDDRKRRLDRDGYDDDRNVRSRHLYREGNKRYSNGRCRSKESDEYKYRHDFSRDYGSYKRVDPYTLNYLVSFSIFNEWYRSTNTLMDIADNEMYQKYEAYKQDLYARLAKPFVYKHMDEPWFKEKYLPDSRLPIYEKIIEIKKSARIVFLECLRNGTFDDFTMDDDESELEHESIPIENATHIFEESFDDNLKTYKNVLSIKNITPNVNYTDLTSLLSGYPIIKNIILSNPNPFRGFMREGFVELNDTAGVENLIQTIQSQKPNEKAGPITVVFYSSPSFPKKILLPPLSNTLKNLSQDLEFAIQAIKKLDKKIDENFDFSEEVKDYIGFSTFDLKENPDDKHKMIKKILDLLIEYLRQVHFFHFYTVTEYDSRYELEKMFPGKVVRLSNQSDDSQLYFKQELWRTKFVEKMNIFLDLEKADLVKLGGKPFDEAVELKIESHIKQEDEKRFRCSVNDCKKLFKGPEFVKKHIEKRHLEWLNEGKKEFILLNNYVLDTSRVFPIEAYSYSDKINQRGALKNNLDVSPKSISQSPVSGSFYSYSPSEKININYDQDINYKKKFIRKKLIQQIQSF